MIQARTGDATGLVARLTASASTLATAQAKVRLLTRRNDTRRWRRAELLWPLFTKD